MAAQSLAASQSLPEVTFALIGDSWNLPTPRDYAHACELGRQYAGKVVRFLRSTPGAAGANIIGRMASQVDFNRQDDGRGVWIGFFAQLEIVLRDAERYSIAMKQLTGELPPEPAVEPIGAEAGAATDDPLVDVFEAEIGGVKMRAADARELHAFLGVARDFNQWLREQIDRARLVDGRDYLTYEDVVQLPSGAKRRKECTLSLDAAKHIGMMSGTNKGFEVRDYFIACERKLLEGVTMQPKVPETYAAALRELADKVDENRALRAENATLRASRNAVSYTPPRTRNALVQTAR